MSGATDPREPSRTPRGRASDALRKVVIITGASQGIGAGLVEGFRGSGYAVVGSSRSIDPSGASDFTTVRGDVAEVETAQMIVERAVNRFGRVDSLINNAGIFISKPFTDYTLEDYRAITAVNLTGFFHMTQAVIGQMLAQGTGGHIVNITTSLVDHPESKNPSGLVSLTKGGLAAATRSLAIEYASRGVRFNAVALGVIENPRYDPASYEGLAQLHPLGRVGQISDVVEGILYLERASFVTGVVLHIDGGQSAGA
jgi:NAD(P)-dependent dehydrogenase (short-subunit alcohol dehydrogenase family)